MNQALCSLRSLEELGIAQAAIRSKTIFERRRAVVAASGLLSPYIRKRFRLPLRVWFDPEEWAPGALAASWALTGTPAKVQDVEVVFTAGGTVGTPGILYTVDLFAGAYGSTPSAATALALSGDIVIDGHTITVSGAVSTGAALRWSTVTDAGAMGAAAMLGAHTLLHARGVDPKTEADLARAREDAYAWAKALGSGDGEIDQGDDATPDRAELGLRGGGQRDPWDWLGGVDGRRRS